MTEKKLSGVKGMNDLLPDQSPVWEWVEGRVAQVFRQYGYRAIRTPIVEPTALFVRGIGEVTDIVEKEMYTFTMPSTVSSSRCARRTRRPWCDR